MNQHARSAIAIVVALGFLGISWFVGHRPGDWEYVFLMFVVFSSALQDALDQIHLHLEKVTELVEESVRKGEYLTRDLRQEAKYVAREVKQESEYLKSHITAQVNSIAYELKLLAALEKGESLPEAPVYPEPELVEAEFVELEPPKLETFDKQKFIAERVREVADALRRGGWWDMSVVTTPLRRLYAYVTSRPDVVRWVSRD
jgi:polyhydroxyalkanoate synthesis regulator phasin